jgi:hypothetical protein
MIFAAPLSLKNPLEAITVAFFLQVAKQIPKPKSGKGFRGVGIPRQNEDGRVRFSFKYACIPGGDSFALPICLEAHDGRARTCAHGYFIALFERLKSVSELAAKDFRSSYSKELRNHLLRFGEDNGLTVDGFQHLPVGLREEVEPAAFQFAVAQHHHGRVLGFYIEDVFFIVWFDPEHNAYA